MHFFNQFLLTISLIITWLVCIVYGSKYALAYPGARKHHTGSISQIGGLTFGIIFITVGYIIGLLPVWFMVGSIISIILGAFDDNISIPWYFKLIVQLLLVAYLSYVFWGRFHSFSFYNFYFAVSPLVLLIIFSIWFVGIYNAVNLIDGLDGLAAGILIILSISGIFFSNGNFLEINLIFSIILASFLIFNQRPAKVFMGDSGSLFLGFYLAVFPLLYMDLVKTNAQVIPMTPFVIMVTFLIADTTRVFFTRLLTGKNPMTPDTIHFHHLIIQKSGSYLLTLGLIFFITTVSGVFSILSLHYNFGASAMLFHLTFLFLFILTPPSPTYVNILSLLIKPMYQWQKSKNNVRLSFIRTLFVMILVLLLFISILLSLNLELFLNLKFIASIFFLTIFIILNKSNKTKITSFQLFITLFIMEFSWSESFGVLIKLVAILLLLTIIVFSFQKIYGTEIYKYSAFDLLIVLIAFGGIFLSIFEIVVNPWIFPIMISLWFGLGFIFRRII